MRPCASGCSGPADADPARCDRGGTGKPNARISEEQVGVAQGQVHQAALRPNPRLYLQSEDIHPWDSNFSFPDNTEDYGYLGQSIEVDGKRGKRIALANANLHRSDAEHTLRTRQFAASVAAAYWMAVADQRIAQLLRQDIAEVDAMVRYNKDRVTAGATRGVDLIRMQIERARIYLSLQAAERDADLARIDLGGKSVCRCLPTLNLRMIFRSQISFPQSTS